MSNAHQSHGKMSRRKRSVDPTLEERDYFLAHLRLGLSPLPPHHLLQRNRVFIKRSENEKLNILLIVDSSHKK